MNKKEFHKVFKKHYQELCRFAYIIVNCTENADEIVQKSFISFWENRNSLQIKKDAKSYLYKTGDLGRYLKDGNIEFLGRVDYQVKMRVDRREI